MKFTAFVAFMRRSGWSFFVAFRVFVAFKGHWGWTLVAFTALVVFMGRWGWTFVALPHLQRLWGVGAVRLALGSCLAFVRFFMFSIGGCLQVWGIGVQASPSH